MTPGEQARRRVGIDVAAAVTLLVLDLTVAPLPFDDPVPTVPQTVLIALTLAAMTLRSRWPVAALALTTAGAACVLYLRADISLVVVAPHLALYAVALRSDRRTTALAWASTALTLALAGVLRQPGAALALDMLPLLPWTATVAAFGQSLRNRRAFLAAMEERAVRAERSREEEARRQVTEERMRIARELHDVVAHHIAVVGVQAGVAQHLMAADPDAAADALGHVRRAAATVLEELGCVLSVLREPGEPVEQVAPAPGLSRLDTLVESFAAAGLDVDWSLHGRPRPLAPTVDLVAYRVLEEALTNALKYGTGTAHLSVEYGASSVTLRAANPTPAALVGVGARPRAAAAGAGGTGHGLLGMRERTAAVGGTLSIGPGPGDSFLVEVDLPVREVRER